MNTTPKEEWAQEFEKELSASACRGINYDFIEPRIRDFIRTTLAAQRKADFEAIEATYNGIDEKLRNEMGNGESQESRYQRGHADYAIFALEKFEDFLATVRSILLPNTEDHEATRLSALEGDKGDNI